MSAFPSDNFYTWLALDLDAERDAKKQEADEQRVLGLIPTTGEGDLLEAIFEQHVDSDRMVKAFLAHDNDEIYEALYDGLKKYWEYYLNLPPGPLE